MSTVLKKIESLSEYYMKEVVQVTHSFKAAKGDKNTILNDWWLSLIFFLDRVFYQGHSDNLPGIYERATIEALTNLLGQQKKEKLIQLRNQRCLNFKLYDFDSKKRVKTPTTPCSVLEATLNRKYEVTLPNGRTGKRSTGKKRDREMTVDILRFISTELETYDYNVLKYAISLIEQRKIKSVYDELRTIRQVGDKTTSLFIRDVVAVYNLENHIGRRDHVLLLPVDTWVRKLSQIAQLNIAPRFTTDQELKERLVDVCLKNYISPIKFNQGIWYLGTHSLELILSGFSLSD